MSYSILRRYTPPTCTLEIMAKQSPLARWAGKPIVKQLRFQLTLDDPTLPKEQWLTLRGDRAQLERLHEAVSTYVQNLLEQSQSQLKVSELPVSDAAIAMQPVARRDTTLATASSASQEISLRSRGLLKHDLALGALATPETPSPVSLNTLQLFDLANALDDYAADLLSLPELSQASQSTSAFPRWGQLAATGLIVIGLSASVAKLIDSRQSASPTANQADSNGQQQAMQPPPAASPLPSIASNQKLPPPPPLGSTVPSSPGLPTIPLAPLPSSKLQPGSAQTNNAPAGAGLAPPNLKASKAPGKETGQIAMMPQNSTAARSRAVPPMPKPLSLNREFSKAPASGATSMESRSMAADRSSQAEPASTAFDTIPQVAEARQYFQQRWTPPQGLTQTLEYTLFVGANGAIQRTMPLGQAAGDYLDRTGIPPIGAPFVSALSNKQNAKIRIVLSPDGTVKTFLEGYY
ncbi:MAG: DUF4335 domain-containing protein [Leptolyngbya sp. BL-A-14]